MIFPVVFLPPSIQKTVAHFNTPPLKANAKFGRETIPPPGDTTELHRLTAIHTKYAKIPRGRVPQSPFSSLSAFRAVREGMRLVDGRPEKLRQQLQDGRKLGHHKACWTLTSRRLAGDARELRLEFNLRFRE
jgi:hypothetical protein